MKFTNEEIKAAKQTRDAIISNNIEELKAIYMAGEICMWDELQQKKAMDYKKTLEQVMDLLNNAEELNMSNYDHDQVRLLNDTFIAVCRCKNSECLHHKQGICMAAAFSCEDRQTDC